MRSIAKVVTRRKLHEPDPDRLYWRSRTPAERLAHLEQLRSDYYGWADGPPRFTKDLDVWIWVDEQNACWDRHIEVEIGSQRVPFISADDLLANKKASGRPQDIADVAALEELSGSDDQLPHP